MPSTRPRWPTTAICIKKYRTDARLQALHQRFAFIAIWDDHEFSDDAWQDAQTYDGSFNADGSDLRQTGRRRNANQAWFECMPADVSFDGANAGFQNIKIYRDFQFGKLMQLVKTDERLYRADHVIPESSINPATASRLAASARAIWCRRICSTRRKRRRWPAPRRARGRC